MKLLYTTDLVKDRWRLTIGLIGLILAAQLTASLVGTYFYRSSAVKGDSMYPTLHDQDRLLLNLSAYKSQSPQRFDIVLLAVNEEHYYVKRIIGLPNETIHYIDDQLFINRVKKEEPFLQHAIQSSIKPYTDDFYTPHSIPKDHYFVLGDHRTNSFDSRDFGLVHKSQLMGRMEFIYWPPQHMQFLHLPTNSMEGIQ